MISIVRMRWYEIVEVAGYIFNGIGRYLLILVIVGMDDYQLFLGEKLWLVGRSFSW